MQPLATELRPHGCVKFGGAKSIYRVRVGGHRVVYQIKDDRLLVLGPVILPFCIRPSTPLLPLCVLHFTFCIFPDARGIRGNFAP